LKYFFTKRTKFDRNNFDKFVLFFSISEYDKMTIAITIFKIKFRFALIVYFRNNSQKMTNTLNQIKSIENLTIESLEIPKTDNYAKLNKFFQEDLKIAMHLIEKK
jgi:hypothetical protein